MKKDNDRDLSLDVIKIISCILVVLMHTLRRYDVNISMYPILYYMTRCSMPLFFMAAGAIQLNKKVITYEYCFGKIKQILLLMFGYYLIDCMVRFISGQIGFNNINEFIADTISLLKSVHWDFGVFWFLRTMIYIYLILPVLHKLYNSKMLILILFLGLICVIFDFLSLTNIIMYDAGSYLQKNIYQEWRLWTWLFFYTIGGYFYARRKIMISLRKLTIMVFLSTISCIAYMFYMLKVRTNIVNGEYAYDSLTMILWVTSIFLLFLRIKFYSIKKFIHLGSSVLIPVYALHIIVICEFQKLSIFYSQYMQIVAYFLIFGICVFIGWIMNKIGYLKFLTRI